MTLSTSDARTAKMWGLLSGLIVAAVIAIPLSTYRMHRLWVAESSCYGSR